MGTRALSPSERVAARLRRRRDWETEQFAQPGIFIPIRVKNPLNNLRGWRQLSREGRAARGATVMHCRDRIPVTLPATITLTRYGVGTLDEGCGLNASLKHVRDGVADVFGVDDADPRYRWVYRQEKARFYGVRIMVEPTKEQ